MMLLLLGVIVIAALMILLFGFLTIVALDLAMMDKAAGFEDNYLGKYSQSERVRSHIRRIY